MKLVNRIFMVFGALSVFSLFQFDAMGSNCSQEPPAGKFCRTWGSKDDCPAGCWCPGGNKMEVGIWTQSKPETQVGPACAGKYENVEYYLNQRSIFYCPNDFPYSDSGSSREDSCYYENGQGGAKFYLRDCGTDTHLHTKRVGNSCVCDEGYAKDSNKECMTCDSDNGYVWSKTKAATCVKQYTVTYKCGEGSGTPPSDSNGYQSGDLVTVKNGCNRSEGKTFYKWKCGSDFVSPGDEFEIKSDTTCTAQWKCAPGYYSSSDSSSAQNVQQSSTETPKKMFKTVNVAGGATCKICEDGWYCPDGVHRKQCLSGRVNENRTECVTSNNEDAGDGNGDGEGDGEGNGGTSTEEQGCGKGTYRKGAGCAVCEFGYFCPGDGERHTCPLEGSPSTDRTTCEVNVPKDKMTKCWNATNFRKCVYGVDVDKWK